jgi:hypothetical protein
VRSSEGRSGEDARAYMENPVEEYAFIGMLANAC